MSIALKYWAFQQTGWGNVDEGSVSPPELPQPSTPGRSDADGGPFLGRYPVIVKRPPLELFDEGFPQRLTLFDSATQQGHGYSELRARLILFDYLQSTAALIQEALIRLTYPKTAAREIAEGLLRAVTALGTLHLNETNTYAVSTAEELFLMHSLEVRIDAHLLLSEMFSAWDHATDRISLFQHTKETIRPFTYQRELVEELEDDTEAIIQAALPVMLMQFLKELEEDDED